jgi:transposase
MGRLYVESFLRATRKEFDMTNATHQPECSAGVLYVAVELGAREWLLTMSSGPAARRVHRRVTAGDQPQLVSAVAAGKRGLALVPDAPVRSCYEAGRDGFWPHRCLTGLGVTNLVVDSSSIEVSRRLRHAKTDRLDGEKLLRMLLRHWGGERGLWQVVRVPSRAREDARQASRALTTLQAERTRARNRIHGLLALHGVRQVRIDAQLPERLEQLRDWAGVPLPPGVQARIGQAWRLLQQVEAERRAAAAEEARATRAHRASCAAKLTQLRGVAARSATILADELFSRGLRDRHEVGALAGLVSAPYRSGTIVRDQGLTRGGIPGVRRVAVELAWGWLRYQPESVLSQWYQRRFGHGGPGTRKIGIVALARRVLVALWRYVDQGIMPQGAQLKA